MPLHSRRLLSKAALGIEGKISIKQNPNRLWPRDHARLRVLERTGSLRWIGTRAGPHLGGTFDTWQITEVGRSRVATWEVAMQSLVVEVSPIPDL